MSNTFSCVNWHSTDFTHKVQLNRHETYDTTLKTVA